MRLNKKVAIITGGGSGLGEAIALKFAAQGAQVVILDINQEKANSVAKQIGKSAIAFSCDVSSYEQVDEAVKKSISLFGKIDVVVNNAGWCNPNQPLWEVGEAIYDKLFSVNVKSIFNMAQAISLHMSKNGQGSIINIGSTAGMNPRPGLTWYNASKSTVNFLAKAMASELAQYNVRVNSIAPTMAETTLLNTVIGDEVSSEAGDIYKATIPLGRFCQPKDVADAATFFASDESEFITGTILPVCGGRTI